MNNSISCFISREISIVIHAFKTEYDNFENFPKHKRVIISMIAKKKKIVSI